MIKGFSKNTPELETKRLILRKLKLDDAKDMFHYASNDLVTQYLLWNSHKVIEDSINFIVLSNKNYQLGVYPYPFGIVLKENNKLIGTIDYINIDQISSRGEIGYVLSQDYWGKDIMPEAALKIMDYGFNRLNLNRIEARCMVDNRKSYRVMEKIGMKCEGILREHQYSKGNYYDMKIYSILKSEYSKVESGK